jgi:hypothetical protein
LRCFFSSETRSCNATVFMPAYFIERDGLSTEGSFGRVQASCKISLTEGDFVMKMSECRRWIAAGVVVAGLWSTATVWALSPVTMKVEAVKPLWEEGKAKYDYAKALEITLANMSPKPQENLVVKFWFVGEDTETKEWVSVKQGELKVEAMKAMERRVVTTEVVAFLNPSASSRSQARYDSRGRQMRGPKENQVTTPKYRGFGVQLVNGDQVLLEVYDPKELKTKLKDLPDRDPANDKEVDNKKQSGKKK